MFIETHTQSWKFMVCKYYYSTFQDGCLREIGAGRNSGMAE